jgi:hypothetical protein
MLRDYKGFFITILVLNLLSYPQPKIQRKSLRSLRLLCVFALNKPLAFCLLPAPATGGRSRRRGGELFRLDTMAGETVLMVFF